MYPFYKKIKTSFFWISFKFTAKLNRKYRDFPIYLLPLPATCLASPIIHIPH